MNFETWWEQEGQYARAGGGEYEKTFAFRAWEACANICESIATKHQPGNKDYSEEKNVGAFECVYALRPNVVIYGLARSDSPAGMESSAVFEIERGKNMTTGRELMMQCSPTIGEVALQKAQELAYIAVARAQTRDWAEHPMFGIAVDKDQWALAYQAKLEELKRLMTPNV